METIVYISVNLARISMILLQIIGHWHYWQMKGSLFRSFRFQFSIYDTYKSKLTRTSLKDSEAIFFNSKLLRSLRKEKRKKRLKQKLCEIKSLICALNQSSNRKGNKIARNENLSEILTYSMPAHYQMLQNRHFSANCISCLPLQILYARKEKIKWETNGGENKGHSKTL